MKFRSTHAERLQVRLKRDLGKVRIATLALLLVWSAPGAAFSAYLREKRLAPAELSSHGIELVISDLPNEVLGVTLTLTSRFRCDLDGANIELRSGRGRLVMMSELVVKEGAIFFLVARKHLQATEVLLECKLPEANHHELYIVRISA